MSESEERIVYENPIIAVGERRVGSIEKFATVHHPGAVAVLAHDYEDMYLTRQFRPAINNSVIELVAGTREESEKPADTAARELAEEIGMRAGSWDLIGSFYSSPGYCDEFVIVYEATDLSEVEKPQADDSGEIEVVEWSIAHLDGAIERARTAKTLCALLWLKNKLR